MNELFNGQMEYENNEKLLSFLDTMELNECVSMLEIALDQAIRNGSFSLKESQVVISCLEKIKKEHEPCSFFI